MTFGEEWGWGATAEESRRMFDAYAEAGGNFLDTANRYTEGTSEKLVGDFTKSDREHFVIATKYTLWMRRDDPNFSGNHRKNLVQSVEASLKRLQTDYIDVLWLHAWDGTTPVEEVMRSLDDLVRQGKVLYIGISDTPAWIVSRANTIAELRGWTSFTGLQIRYNLIDRTAERDLLPMARALDLAVTPWRVLHAGVLTGKYQGRLSDGDNGADAGSGDGRVSKSDAKIRRNLEIAAEVVAVAEEIGCKPAHVAISWLRQRPGVIVPIIGARTLEQLNDNIASLAVKLSDTHMERLDAVSAFDLGFPHDFLANDPVRDNIFGGTQDMIDNHRA